MGSTSMIAARHEKGSPLPACYDQVSERLDLDLNELEHQGNALFAKLRDAGEDESYIEKRMAGFGVQADYIIGLKPIALVLKNDSWTP
jgi:hypothetical protein